MEILEQVNYLITNLSERPENAEVIAGLQTVKSVAQMTPSSIPPMIAGVTRYVLSREQFFLSMQRNPMWEREDTVRVVMLNADYRVVIDEVPKCLREKYDQVVAIHDELEMSQEGRR